MAARPPLSADRELVKWMRYIRRELHRYPELAFAEFKTAAFVVDRLAELGIAARTGVGGTGVVATLAGKVEGAGAVALRADMDGLPLDDAKDGDCVSQVPGVMHACGHDGHVAMLLGGLALLRARPVQGSVVALFQPAEERGNGAQKMVQAGVLTADVEAIFGGHIDTRLPTGVMSVDEGVVCSFAEEFTITVEGQGGHGARPHEARDALVAGAYLVTALQTLVSREIAPMEPAVVTVGTFRAGSAHNAIAARARLKGTVRATERAVRERLVGSIERIGAGIGELYGVGVRTEFHDPMPAVVNSPQATGVARRAAHRVVGCHQVVSQGPASLGGEDFAFYLERVEGCLVRFGAGRDDRKWEAHTATFDFDEDVLALGAAWFAEVAHEWFRGAGGESQDD